MSENERPGALSTRQRRLVAAVLSESTVRDAAAAADVAESTAYRYLADSDVRAELASRQGAMLAQVAAGLVTDMAAARQVLRDTMADPRARPHLKLRAAQLTLEHAARLAEVVALEDRVAELEKRAPLILAIGGIDPARDI